MPKTWVFVGAIVCALSLSASAMADPPSHDPLPAPDSVLSGICTFDVAVHFTKQKEKAITFSNGSFIVTGQFKATLTNARTGKTVDINIPGPGKYTVADDGTLTINLTGPWLIFTFAGQTGPGSPGMLLYTTGKGTFIARPDGTVSFQHDQGTTTNLCAALG
jgi:hypothetical protein